MLIAILSLVVVGLLVCLSVKMRITGIVRRNAQPVIQVDSPVSEAIKQLMGTAGGIYLSLVMAADFMKLDIVDKLYLYNWGVDPLALFSVVTAIVQPFVHKIMIKIQGG